MEGHPEERFDVITCRNSVFLYIPKHHHEFCLKRIVEDCLEDGGFLIIGRVRVRVRDAASLKLIYS